MHYSHSPERFNLIPRSSKGGGKFTFSNVMVILIIVYPGHFKVISNIVFIIYEA